jgi:hypothetical protein
VVLRGVVSVQRIVVAQYSICVFCAMVVYGIVFRESVLCVFVVAEICVVV